jgi:Flavin reductase like domain
VLLVIDTVSALADCVAKVPVCRAVSRLFGGRIPVGERFAAAAWSTPETGAPVLADSAAALDCRIIDVASVDAHGVLLCRVVAALQRSDCADNLIYFGRNYRAGRPGLTAVGTILRGAPDRDRGAELQIFPRGAASSSGATPVTGCSPSFEDSCVLNGRETLHSSNRSALMRMTGSDEAGSLSKNDARVYYITLFCYISTGSRRRSLLR